MPKRQPPAFTPAVVDASVRRLGTPEHLWGLSEIAQAMGLSRDTVRRTLERGDSGIPVYRPGGRYYASRADLLAWLRRDRA